MDGGEGWRWRDKLERDTHRQRQRQTEIEAERERERERTRTRKRLFYKNCSSDSVKNLSKKLVLAKLLMNRYQITGIIYIHIGMNE